MRHEKGATDQGFTKEESERADKMEYTTPTQERTIPKAAPELHNPGVLSVRHNYRTGLKTIRFEDGRLELRDLESGKLVHMGKDTTRKSLNPRAIVEVAEATLRRFESKRQASPRQIVEDLESRLGVSRPLTFWDTVDCSTLDRAIKKPADFEDRLREQFRARDQKMKREVADLCERWKKLRRPRYIASNYF